MASEQRTATEPRRPLNFGGGRRFALAAFAVGAVAVAAASSLPDYGRSLVHGPMVPGHESLACTECHRTAPGTMRQQVQANLLHWAGWRSAGASFGHEAVDAQTCRGCHQRDNDRHPSFRFREPRFQTVNKTLDARDCLTCHSEHGAQRVSNEGTFCGACHDDMKARKEVIQPTHADLSAGKRWETCLTCHDFHGNHAVKAPRRFEEAHDLRAVRAYLGSGADPYATVKIHPANTSPLRNRSDRREAEAGAP